MFCHEGTKHTHLHVHEWSDAPDHDSKPHRHRHAALGIGVLHGFAGSNHLLGVLPSLAMTQQQAVFYIAGYLAAAVLTMALFGALVGWISRVAGGRRSEVGRIPAALRVAGWICIAVGVVWLVLGLRG